MTENGQATDGLQTVYRLLNGVDVDADDGNCTDGLSGRDKRRDKGGHLRKRAGNEEERTYKATLVHPPLWMPLLL
jgi:hypothetical protein